MAVQGQSRGRRFDVEAPVEIGFLPGRFFVRIDAGGVSGTPGQRGNSADRRSCKETMNSHGHPLYVAILHCVAFVLSTDPTRMGDAVPLSVVDAEKRQLAQGLVVLHPFGDRRNTQHPPDLGDRIDHGAVERIADEIAHERAVDLEKVDGQRLEIGEGAQPGAEVVQSEAAADALQALQEMYRFREIADSRGLGYLEAHRGGLDAERGDLLVYELEERLVAERGSGQVDRDDASRIRGDLALGHETARGL